MACPGALDRPHPTGIGGKFYCPSKLLGKNTYSVNYPLPVPWQGRSNAGFFNSNPNPTTLMNPNFIPTLDRLANTQIPTLGRRSKFSVLKKGSEYFVSNSSGEEYPINPYIDSVHARYTAATTATREMTSHYTDPAWPECPHRIVAPYIAAILREHD